MTDTVDRVSIRDVSFRAPADGHPGYGFLRLEARYGTGFGDDGPLTDAQAELSRIYDSALQALQAAADSCHDSPEAREVTTLAAQLADAQERAASLADQLTAAEAKIDQALADAKARLRAVVEVSAEEPEGREVATLQRQLTETQAQADKLAAQLTEAQASQETTKIRRLSDSLGPINDRVTALGHRLTAAQAAYREAVKRRVNEERQRLRAQAEADFDTAKESLRRALIVPTAAVFAVHQVAKYLETPEPVTHDILGN